MSNKVQISWAHPTDKVGEQKILKRVCNQHKTGIHKPFAVMGRTCRILISWPGSRSFDRGPRAHLIFLDISDEDQHFNLLEEVTPEAILEVIRRDTCRQIMES